MRAHHPVFHNFQRYTGPGASGFKVDFLGVRTRSEFGLALGACGAGVLQTEYPPSDNEYFEWIDILESVLGAEQSFTMFELGAGFGRWLVRAAAALRQRGRMPFHLVAVEAEPRHFDWLTAHFLNNGLNPEEHTLIQAAVTDRTGEALFYVGMPEGGDDAPDEWYGQAISEPQEFVQDERYGTYEGAVVSRLNTGWKAVRVRTVRLPDLMRNFQLIDLVDLDIQGEEYRVISAALEELNQKAKRLHIATHAHDLEDALRRLLRRHGWKCLADYACQRRNRTPWGRIRFVDGVQRWINPRLS